MFGVLGLFQSPVSGHRFVDKMGKFVKPGIYKLCFNPLYRVIGL